MANTYAKSTTFNGYSRNRGTKGATPAVMPLILKGTIADPTSSTQQSLFTLPAGAIPLNASSLGGATGGTNPTVDVGTTGDDDGIANELDADGVSLNHTPGALCGTELTAETVIYGKVGASAATGGATVVLVQYIMADDGGEAQ